jgi:hypothetical protein
VAVDDPDELYGLPLDEFVPERDALAKRLRSDGRRGDAAEVKALRKPSVAAWGVNQAVRTQPRAARDLWDAGDALIGAQGDLLEGRGDAAGLRAAVERERSALGELVEAAQGLLTSAGRDLGESTIERVRETLHAAAIDPDARAHVAPGRVTREMAHAGLGGIEAAPAPPALAPDAPPGDPAPGEPEDAPPAPARKRAGDAGPARRKRGDSGSGKGRADAGEADGVAAARSRRERQAEERAAAQQAERERREQEKAAAERAERERRERARRRADAERELRDAGRALERAQRTAERAGEQLQRAQVSADEAQGALEAAEARRDAAAAELERAREGA